LIPDADEPVPLNPQQYEQDMIETMSQAGIDPALHLCLQAHWEDREREQQASAHRKKELRQWNDAIDEYHRRVESGEVVSAIRVFSSPSEAP
jgi:hypothetical protein